MESSNTMPLLVAIKAVLSAPIAPVQGIISADDTFQYFQHEFYQSAMKDEVSTLKVLIGFLQEKLKVAEKKIVSKSENSILAEQHVMSLEAVKGAWRDEMERAEKGLEKYAAHCHSAQQEIKRCYQMLQERDEELEHLKMKLEESNFQLETARIQLQEMENRPAAEQMGEKLNLLDSISAEETQTSRKKEDLHLKYLNNIIKEQVCKIEELRESLSYEEDKVLKIKDKFQKYRQTFICTEEQVNTLQEKLYRMEFYQEEDRAHISKLKIYVRDLQLNK